MGWAAWSIHVCPANAWGCFVQVRLRALLREHMLAQGFEQSECEFWHFKLADEPFPDTVFDFDIE
jgi:D-alanyl-D-alanine dipeptidase